MTPEELGSWLRDWNLTYKQAAALLGCHFTMIWRYKSGRVPMSNRMALRVRATIARRLNTRDQREPLRKRTNDVEVLAYHWGCTAREVEHYLERERA